MLIGFRADGSRHMGSGHLMRCLALAEEVTRRGHEALFIAAAVEEPHRRRIREAGHHLFLIEPVTGIIADKVGWEAAPLAGEAQFVDAARTREALSGRRLEWMIMDHYLLSSPWEERIRPAVERIAVIDDLANRTHDCDILLDQTFGRVAEHYRELVPDRAAVLVGGAHALLRPEFRAARSAYLKRRTAGKLERILISLGTGDLGGLTTPALKAAMAAAKDCAIDVVLGEMAPSMKFVRQLAATYPRIRIHVETSRMAGLMMGADVSIGAGGMTSWERCCLGLPSVVVVLAENQRETADFLHEIGAGVRSEPDEEAIRGAFETLVFSRAAREAMSARAAGLCDGAGAERVAARLCALSGEASSD